MELRTMRYFLAVAREENMTRAAELLHVTQPTLSKAMKSLEKELGQKLFTRHSFSIRLTEEGLLLRKRAEDLVGLADRISGEFSTLGDVAGGDVYFGLAESYQVRYLAREIKAFRRAYPSLRYHITSGDTEQVVEKLDRGVLDFALLADEPDSDKYEFVALPEKDAWGVVMPEGSPLAQKSGGCVNVDDLAGLPLFCSEQAWRNDIPRWCGDRMDELVLEGSFRLAYNGSVFAREGLGYLLALEHLIDVSEGSGLAFKLLEPRLETGIYLVWRRLTVLSPIAKRFLAHIESAFGEEGGSPGLNPAR